MANMEQLAREFKEIKAQVDAMEAQAEALKQQMIKGMDEAKAEKLTVGAYKISYTIFESARFDTTGFRKTMLTFTTHTAKRQLPRGFRLRKTQALTPTPD